MSNRPLGAFPPRCDRRDVLKLAGLAGLALGLSACGRGFGGNDDEPPEGSVQLNMVWWGAADRAEKTKAALDIFHRKNPGITVKTEYQDSGPYKDKLATRFAAGDPPDLMASRMDSLREYADRGVLLDLTPHRDAVGFDSLTESSKNLATVRDKIYGIPAGLNVNGFVVNKTLTAKFGVPIPDGDTWSWQDLSTLGQRVTEASGKKVYGVYFEPFNVSSIDIFARQRGEDFYTEDGRLGLSEATVTAWFTMIEKMRTEGAFPPAGFIEDVGTSPEQSYLAKGKISAQVIPTNNFLANNAVAGGNLALLRMPGETQGVRRGMSVGCPHLWSIAAASKHPKEALKLLDFLTNDVEGMKALGTTRGVPSNSKVAEEIKPTLHKDDQIATDYLLSLQKEPLPRSFPHPPGASKITAHLRSVASEVEFKRLTPAQAGKAVVTEGRKALEK